MEDKLNPIPDEDMIKQANLSAGKVEGYTPQNNEKEAWEKMEEVTQKQLKNQEIKKQLLAKQKTEIGLTEIEEYDLNTILALERRPDLSMDAGTETVIIKSGSETVTPRPITEKPVIPSSNINDDIIAAVPPGYRPIVETYNQPFDMIPLPSEGKIYPHKKKSVKVAYLNAADENILTSPNLVASGEFLPVLLERKIIDPDFNLDDLHSGDRNAILIWLRATGYGPKYPISIYDPIKKVDIDTIFDLNLLKTKHLGAEPDRHGWFDYKFKRLNKVIKFKLLTVGDLNIIDSFIEYEKEILKLDTINGATHRFRKQIVEVDGSRDADVIDRLIDSIPLSDSLDFQEYIDSIESGIDLSITIEVPGREPIATFLPLTQEFFWPSERL